MLSERLMYLANLVPKCQCIADIGCDHGLLTKHLLDEGVIMRAVLTDISFKSLEKARKLISKEYKDCVFYHSDGVFGVKEKFDVAVIAGMGGLLTSKIIFEGKLTNLVLQPMNNAPILREFLVSNGYKICFDKIFFDKKFYNFITAQIGEDSLTEREIAFGRTNLKERGEHFINFLVSKRKSQEMILQGVQKDNRDYERIIKTIEEIDFVLGGGRE